MRIRYHLVVALVAVLVPMVAFAVLVMAAFGRQQRAAVERGAVDTARALINALDENLRSTITRLDVLATAESLAADDLRAFDLLARRALGAQPDWYDVILFGGTATRSSTPNSPSGHRGVSRRNPRVCAPSWRSDRPWWATWHAARPVNTRSRSGSARR